MKQITHLCFFIGDGNRLINGWFSNFPASHVSFQRGGISNQKAAFHRQMLADFLRHCVTFVWLQLWLGTFCSIFGNPRLTQLFFLSFFTGEMVGHLFFFSVFSFWKKTETSWNEQKRRGVVTRNGGFVWSCTGSVEKFSWYRALQLLWNLQLLGLHPERTSYNMVCSSCERDERPGQLGNRKRWPDFRLLASEIGRNRLYINNNNYTLQYTFLHFPGLTKESPFYSLSRLMVKIKLECAEGDSKLGCVFTMLLCLVTTGGTPPWRHKMMLVRPKKVASCRVVLAHDLGHVSSFQQWNCWVLSAFCAQMTPTPPVTIRAKPWCFGGLAGNCGSNSAFNWAGTTTAKAGDGRGVVFRSEKGRRVNFYTNQSDDNLSIYECFCFSVHFFLGALAAK